MKKLFLHCKKEKLLKAERKSNLVRRKIKRRMRVKEGKVVARKDIIHVLTTRNRVIRRIFVSIGQVYNADHASNLVM